MREIAERVGASEGIEIVDVQLLGGGGSRVLRIFIDKPAGVTHADCEFISQHVGTILDVEDVIPGATLHARSQLAGRGAQAHQAARIRALCRARRSRSSCAQPVENQRHWVGALQEFRRRNHHARTFARQERAVSARAGGKGEPQVRVVILRKIGQANLYEPGNDLSVHRNPEQGKGHRSEDHPGRGEGRHAGGGAQAFPHQRRSGGGSGRADRRDPDFRREAGGGRGDRSGQGNLAGRRARRSIPTPEIGRRDPHSPSRPMRWAAFRRRPPSR